MSQLSVAILGAGLAGLTLGRCLRQRGIPSVVYERASSAPRHTYGITLEPWAIKPLLEILGLDEHTFRRRVAVDSFTPGGVGKIYKATSEAKDLDTSAPFRANRNKLESMLGEGQNINLDHALSSARLCENGDDGAKVELLFQNNQELRSRLVIDTLGVHSQLRKSLISSAELEVHPFAVYSSKRSVKPAQFASVYAPAFGDGNMMVREPDQANGPRLEITINEYLANGNVSISYVYSRAAKLEGADPLHNPHRPIPSATEIPEEFYEEVEDFINDRNLEQPFRECFDAQQIRTERLLHWLMRTIMVPKEEMINLLKYGVVMIGDSAHAVPILGGHGANMAICDAIKLAGIIGETGADPNPIQEFYDRNWHAWNAAVSKSSMDLAELHRAVRSSL